MKSATLRLQFQSFRQASNDTWDLDTRRCTGSAVKVVGRTRRRSCEFRQVDQKPIKIIRSFVTCTRGAQKLKGSVEVNRGARKGQHPHTQSQSPLPFFMAERKAERSGLTQTEEKELHRVFDHLANYPAKRDIYAILNPKSERRTKIISHKKSPSVVKIYNASNQTLSEEEIDEEFKRLDEECKEGEAQIAALDNNPDRKIRPIDLQECLKDLGRPCSKKEIADMIWEVPSFCSRDRVVSTVRVPNKIPKVY